MSDQPLQDYRFDTSTIVHRAPAHPTRHDLVVMSPRFHADPLEPMAWMRSNAPVY